MGLFNSKKKTSNQPSNNQSSIKPVPAFYSDCVADFHNEAMKHGIAKRGLIFIPELLPVGEKVVLAFLQDTFFQMEFKGDPGSYYYLIMSLCIDSGMCLATRWHEQFSTLNQYVDEIILKGPADDANALMDIHFTREVMGNQGNVFFSKIFDRWLEMVIPYMKLSDSRDYIFKAMMAAYQLGVSMILEKYGY